MANKNKTELKNYFQTGLKPTQSQFEDLIDSNLNLIDDKASLSDADQGENDEKFTTPKSVKRAIETFVPNATISTKGIAEIATLGEVEEGIDNERIVTPEGARRSVETFSPVKSVNGQTGDVVVQISSEDSGWQTPVLSNSIVNYSTTYVGARFRLLNGVVFIEGTIKGGASQTNGTSYLIFQLPAGYRPSKRLIFSTFKNGGGGSRIDIDTAGRVFGVIYDDVLTSLTGISFVVKPTGGGGVIM